MAATKFVASFTPSFFTIHHAYAPATHDFSLIVTLTITHTLLQHLQQLVRLTQLRHEDRLTFGYTPIVRIKLAVPAERVDLVQSEVVRVKIAWGVGTAVFEDFIKTFLDCREFVCLIIVEKS